MARFTRKPVDAMQWTGRNTPEIIVWVRSTGNYIVRWYPYIPELDFPASEADVFISEHLVVADRDGLLLIVPSDWLIKTREGTHEKVPHPQFMMDYAPANEGHNHGNALDSLVETNSAYPVNLGRSSPRKE